MEGEEQNGGWNNFSASSDEFTEEADNIGFNDANIRQALRRKEKFRSILVVVVGIGALFFGMVAFYFNLTNPFLPIMLQAQKDLEAANEQQRQALLVLQTRDTDQDGLTDYEELNKYNTSPYIADSDSDGISDKDEVLRGTDPNCPEGQSCFSAGLESTSTVYTAPSLNGTLVTQASPNITASFIRQTLKDSGVSETDLEAFSDTELMAEFATYLNENPDVAQVLADEGYDFSGLSGLKVPTTKTTTSTTVTTNNSNSNQPVISTLDDLKNASGADIRKWLISRDTTTALTDKLNSMTDEEVKAMALSEAEKIKNQ